MHNPLRSERDVFRAVVIIGIGAGAVIALTLLTRPALGAALLAAEVGLGVGLLWRGSQGSLRGQAEVAHRAGRHLPGAGDGQRDGRRTGPAGRDPEPLQGPQQRDPGRGPGADQLANGALGVGRRRSARGGEGAPRRVAATDGGRRHRRPRPGRRSSRAERVARGRAAGLPGRRGDHLDPSAGAVEVAGARGGREGSPRRSRCRSPTWSSTSRRRRRRRRGPPARPPDPIDGRLAFVYSTQLGHRGGCASRPPRRWWPYLPCPPALCCRNLIRVSRSLGSIDCPKVAGITPVG